MGDFLVKEAFSYKQPPDGFGLTWAMYEISPKSYLIYKEIIQDVHESDK